MLANQRCKDMIKHNDTSSIKVIISIKQVPTHGELKIEAPSTFFQRPEEAISYKAQTWLSSAQVASSAQVKPLFFNFFLGQWLRMRDTLTHSS